MRRRISSRQALLGVAGAGIGLLLAMCGAAAPLAPPAAPAAQPATAPALSPADRALLHQLESGTWRERQSAEEDLAARPDMDDAAIRAMLAATKSPEAKSRLDAILKHLAGRREAGTSPITLHVKDAPAKAVYAELFRQAFAKIDPEPDNLLDDPALPKLTVDADHQPFWTVEQQLANSSGIGLNMTGSGGYELRRGAVLEPGPQAIGGPLLCVLMQEGRHFGMHIDRAGPHVDLMIYPEPKVRALVSMPGIHLEEAIDNHGNHLQLSAERWATAVSNEQRQVGWQIRFDPAPHNPGDRLTRLRATLSVQLGLNPQHADISDVMHAAPRDFHFGKMTIKFEGCKGGNGFYQVVFSITGADAQVQLVQLIQGQIAAPRLLDADGNPLAGAGKAYSTDAHGAKITYMFRAAPGRNGAPAAAPEPSRLIDDLPTEMKTVDVLVDFKDINVPVNNNW